MVCAARAAIVGRVVLRIARREPGRARGLSAAGGGRRTAAGGGRRAATARRSSTASRGGSLSASAADGFLVSSERLKLDVE